MTHCLPLVDDKVSKSVKAQEHNLLYVMVSAVDVFLVVNKAIWATPRNGVREFLQISSAVFSALSFSSMLLTSASHSSATERYLFVNLSMLFCEVEPLASVFP